MSNHGIANIFDRLESLSVGFGPVFRDFQLTTPSYPPHNIIKISENEFQIEVAVAGFKRDEISIEEHQSELLIKGNKVSESKSETIDYQYRGIAGRSFSKSFRIAEYFEVSKAELADGILTITFVKNVPDEVKPKSIAIS